MDDRAPFSIETAEEADFPAFDEPRMDAPPKIEEDERRIHVRAYNYWVSLLDGRTFPAIEDIDPESVRAFGPNSVLLDFSRGAENATIASVGSALRQESGIGNDIRAIADVPVRSVLSRLTGHYLEIIANRAPVGFEAEYENDRGHPVMYRGILMPFSSDGERIDYIYGVINWKEIAGRAVVAPIGEALSAALHDAPLPEVAPQPVPVWADGPNALPLAPAGEEESALVQTDEPHPDGPLFDRLVAARLSAETLGLAEQRSHTALYHTLGRAYDFALAAEEDPEGYASLIEDAGLKVQARAPMTPLVKLIFGATYDKTRLAEYAAALAHGLRHDVQLGEMTAFLEGYEGGLKAMVRAERDARRPAVRPDRAAAARKALATAPALATVSIEGIEDAFVSLIGRREADGTLAILSVSAAPEALLEKATKGLKG